MKFLGLDVLDDLVRKIKGKVETELSTKANITSLNLKQDKLTAGANITIDENNVISATGGGGGGGTTDYTQLSNKPSINSVTLSGNKSLDSLGIQAKLTAGNNITITSNNKISSYPVNVLEEDVELSDGSTCSLESGFYYTDVYTVVFHGTSTDTTVVSEYQLFYFEGGEAQTFITPAFQLYYTTDTNKWMKDLNDYNTDTIEDDNYKIPTSKAVYLALQQIGDYTNLSNKPSINNVTLTGNKTASDLGLGDVPVGSVIQYDGNTIPTGFEEVNGLENYSTTEQKIGTWTNGKPLYRVVMQVNNPQVTSDGTIVRNRYNLPDPNIDFSYVKSAFNNGSSERASLPYITNAGYRMGCSVSNTEFILYSNATTFNGGNSIAIIEYTKSTDTAS